MTQQASDGGDTGGLPDDWRFLIVDDNPAALATLRTLMAVIGLEPPLEALGGDEAMSVVRTEPLDCIITDLRMEPISGADFIRQVRNSREAASPGVRILAVSAYRDQGEVDLITAAGANGFMSKPLSVGRLKAVLTALAAQPERFIDNSATDDATRLARMVRDDGHDD